MARPLANGGNGDRDARGRFAPGNPGGPGNPHARRVAAIRRVILESVTDDDIRAVVRALVESACKGDVKAAAELFNRLVGKATDAVCSPDELDAHEHRLKLAGPNRIDALLAGLDG